MTQSPFTRNAGSQSKKLSSVEAGAEALPFKTRWGGGGEGREEGRRFIKTHSGELTSGRSLAGALARQRHPPPPDRGVPRVLTTIGRAWGWGGGRWLWLPFVGVLMHIEFWSWGRLPKDQKNHFSAYFGFRAFFLGMVLCRRWQGPCLLPYTQKSASRTNNFNTDQFRKNSRATRPHHN